MYSEVELKATSKRVFVLCKDFNILMSKFSTSTIPKIHFVCLLKFAEVLVSVSRKTNKVV